jgi:TRAP-type C4-dicarboxylate transport system permease small subunit
MLAESPALYDNKLAPGAVPSFTQQSESQSILAAQKNASFDNDYRMKRVQAFKLFAIGMGAVLLIGSNISVLSNSKYETAQGWLFTLASIAALTASIIHVIISFQKVNKTFQKAISLLFVAASSFYLCGGALWVEQVHFIGVSWCVGGFLLNVATTLIAARCVMKLVNATCPRYNHVVIVEANKEKSVNWQIFSVCISIANSLAALLLLIGSFEIFLRQYSNNINAITVAFATTWLIAAVWTTLFSLAGLVVLVRPNKQVNYVLQ